MVFDVAKWLVDLWIQIWNFLYTGGIIGGSIIVLFILGKLVDLFRQFTN